MGDRRVEVPRVRLVTAEDEREHALGRVLAEREAEPCSPGRTEEVRAPDAEGVEDGDSIPHARGQRVRARVIRLVAAALTAVIGEDQPELAAQCSGEARRLRNLQRIREAGVEEDGWARTSRVLEVGADAVPGVRRVRQGSPFGRVLNLSVCRARGDGGLKRYSLILAHVGVSSLVPQRAAG